MQLEDKLVEDGGAARAELQQREDVLSHGEEQLPEAVREAVSEASVELRGKLLGAIRMVLEEDEFEISELRLPAHEAGALEALQMAVSGRSGLGTFVFASDRRDLLEQALAVLQPNLSHVDAMSARELQGQFDELTARVGDLRHALTNLEDAQDDLIEVQQPASLAQGDAAPGDKPKPGPTPRPSDPDAPRPATTLTGPELPQAPAPATTLVGADLPVRPAPPTTLVGADLPERAAPPTTLVGPDLPEPRPPATTLVGPDLPEPRPPTTTLVGPDLAPEPTLASTLGDAKDLAEQAQKPWWRRPFG